MRSFEKFRSRALNSDALKEVKGGANITNECDLLQPECKDVSWSCRGLCDFDEFVACVWNYQPDCSPLYCWDHVCVYDCPRN